MFFDKTEELIHGRNNYDILFLGNSRAHFGINPYYIDSITWVKSYNFGNGGADAQAINMVSDLYLQSHKAPVMVVISLDMSALTKREILKTFFYYLYYLDNDTISKNMKQVGFNTSLIKFLPFTKYSFFDEYNRTSLFVKGTKLPVFDHNIYKGFINIHQHAGSAMSGLFNTKPDNGSVVLWDTAVNYLRNTISRLQQKGTMVVLVTPPEKKSSFKKSEGLPFKKIADSVYDVIAGEYHLKYFHFENSGLFTDDFFSDEIHLNEPGTKVYSRMLADSLKTIYPYLPK